MARPLDPYDSTEVFIHPLPPPCSNGSILSRIGGLVVRVVAEEHQAVQDTLVAIFFVFHLNLDPCLGALRSMHLDRPNWCNVLKQLHSKSGCVAA